MGFNDGRVCRLPYLSLIVANSNQCAAVGAVRDMQRHLLVLVLQTNIHGEQILVELGCVKYLFSNFKTALGFDVWNSVLFNLSFSFFRITFENLDTLFFFTLSNHKICFESFSFMFGLENKLIQLSHHLSVANFGSRPAVHHLITFAIIVAIIEDEGLLPEATGLLICVFFVEKGDNSFLV